MKTEAEPTPGSPSWLSAALSGDVDGESLDVLRLVVGSAGPGQGVVIDLSAVTFLDPAGIGAIVGAVRSLNERGARAAVICSRPGLTGILRANRIEEVAILVPAAADLAASIQGAAPIAC